MHSGRMAKVEKGELGAVPVWLLGESRKGPAVTEDQLFKF